MTQLPSPQGRPAGPHHAKRLRPKTYSVAVYLVIGIVLLQVVMLISVFWLRAMVVPIKVLPPKGLYTQTPPSPTPPALIGPLPPPPGTVTPPKSDLSSLPGLQMTPPHPALLSVPDASDKLAQIGSLNDEALAFLHQHAYASAEETLLKAEDIDPRNPNTLKNLAETYNMMNDLPRSKIYWQRLTDLGPGVGTVYAVAKDHVLLLNSTHDADALREPSTLSRLLYVNAVEKTPVETRNGAQFHLRTVLMRKNPQMPSFDQKKLQPYVIFYQQLPDGRLVPDLGQRKGAFDDTFLFWGGKKSEAFSVDYVMPVPGTLGPDNQPVGEYYGFIIGIYYDKILQDACSEPSDLITKLPLPQEIE